MEKAVRSACMERESVQECVRMRMWTREASVVGEGCRIVGGGGVGAMVQGLMSGICIGGGVWRCRGSGGGETVVARVQPADKRREARKKCCDCFLWSVMLYESSDV